MDNYFEKLNAINVNDKTEKRAGLTYLSWAFAWGEIKKAFPKSFYTIYENAEGLFYHTDGKTCWVKTGVTMVDGDFSLEHIEYLPVMDNRNKSIPLNSVTSFDINKAIQRSLTKAVARHGLGLYIYAGEDLPEGAEGKEEAKADKPEKRAERINALTMHHGITLETFAEFLKTLQDEGKVARKTVKMMTDDEFLKMLGQVHEALQATRRETA